jgi:hypothetical protein
MTEYLSQLFVKLEEHINDRNYVLKIIDRKRFKKQFVKEKEVTIFDIFGELEVCEGQENLENQFVFDEKQIDEYVSNLMICKWLYDHRDTRYRDFTYILRPNKIQIDMRNVSFDELMKFMSPQTKKTME